MRLLEICAQNVSIFHYQLFHLDFVFSLVLQVDRDGNRLSLSSLFQLLLKKASPRLTDSFLKNIFVGFSSLLHLECEKID